MRLDYTEGMPATMWLFTGCLVVVALDVASIPGWTLFVGTVLAPPLVILQMWRRGAMAGGLQLQPQEVRR